MVKKIASFFVGLVLLFLFGTKMSLAATYTVTKTADTNDGTCNSDCSAREAVAAANGNSGADIIEFNIPESDGGYITPTGNVQGYFSIVLGSTLTISDDSGVFINGYSQTGSSRNTTNNGESLNTVLKIQMSSAWITGVYSLTITGDNNHIAGISIPYRSGVNINTSSTNWIEGNFFGSSINGLTVTDGSAGLQIDNSSSSNTIGTNGDGSGDSGERNLFIGSTAQFKILIQTGTNSNNIIAGNYLGIDKTGRNCETQPQGRAMISVFSGTGNRVGSNLDGVSDFEEANIIACVNNNARALIQLGTGTGTLVQGNYIGTNPYGDNLYNGFFGEPGIGDNGTASNNVIKRNVIKYNGGAGILLDTATSVGNTISQNIITNNSGIGIDLGLSSAGVTANDAGDSDTGSNDLMNFPNITSITYLGNSQYKVDGTLDFLSSESPFTVEICLADYNSTGHGGCTQYLGATTAQTPYWSATVSMPTDDGTQCRVFSATATNTSGSTSEYSNNSVTGICSNGTPTNSAQFSHNSAQSTTVIEKNNVLSIVNSGTFKYDANISVLEIQKSGTYRLPDTNYWQVGPKKEIWWKSFSNGAKILSSEVQKPFTLVFKYDPSSLEKSVKEKSLRLMHSVDGKKWKLTSSILDTNKKELSIVTKNGGFYIIVGGGYTDVPTPKVQSAKTRLSSTDGGSVVETVKSEKTEWAPVVKKHCFLFVCWGK